MSLLSICPRITKANGRLIARTAWCLRILFFGTFYREVTVEPHKKTVTVVSRYFWLFRRRRRIRFPAIQAVTYGYSDLSQGSVTSASRDSVDWFTVGLRFIDDSEMHLFSFLGDGTFVNESNFPDWMYWEEFLFDHTGTQEKESRVFVDLLSKLIGVTVVPPGSS